MFESDDWDLDQDFLNDVDERATQFYSQSDNREVESTKRRKMEICDDLNFSSNSDEDWSMDKAVNKNATACKEDKSSRKNLILGMFNKSSLNKNDSQDTSNSLQKAYNTAASKSHLNLSQNSENSQVPRKNLVLGILQKTDTQNKVTQSKQYISNNMKNSNLQKTEPKFETKGNIKCQAPTINHSKENKTSNGSHSKISETLLKSNDKVNSFNDSRRQILFDALKTTDNTEFRKNPVKNNSSLMKNPQVQPSKKTTMIRRFPGPAGLLPDDMDTTVPPISYLNSLEENENDRPKDPPESNLSEYCSQNTKNLFTEGAWQLMLDDLPHDFLKGYEIATVKQMANVNHCQSTKVQFLAGVLEYIDHSHDNPPIVLKDFTDSIKGILHRDIPLKYPGMLEPNVVILLHDVGLLKTSGLLVKNKYHILISPSTLLAVYSDKGKIVHTPYMDSLLGNTLKGKTEIKQGDNNKKNVNNIQNSSKKCLNADASWNETFESMNESINLDLTNDLSFSASANEITNSQNQRNFNSPSSKSMKPMNKVDKQQSPKECLMNKKASVQNSNKGKSENLLQTLKKFASDANKNKKLSSISKTIKSDAERLVASSSTCLEESKSRISNKRLSGETSFNESGIDLSEDKAKSSLEKSNVSYNNKTESVQLSTNKEKSKPSIRSTLLQFKNKDILTPSEFVESTTSTSISNENSQKSQTKNSLSTGSNSFRNLLCNSENDSDDEMLSQLDVDTIFSNYNNEH